VVRHIEVLRMAADHTAVAVDPIVAARKVVVVEEGPTAFVAARKVVVVEEGPTVVVQREAAHMVAAEVDLGHYTSVLPPVLL